MRPKRAALLKALYATRMSELGAEGPREFVSAAEWTEIQASQYVHTPASLFRRLEASGLTRFDGGMRITDAGRAWLKS